MNEECDHVALTALTDALGVPMRVVYLDGSAISGDSVDSIDFISGAARERGDIRPRVFLLYRPGHYDILYPML